MFGTIRTAWSPAARFGPLALLVLSMIALAAAPALVPESYSLTANTSSESAAQGVEGAWLARLGFLLFGFGVIWLARRSRTRWGPSGTALHTAFGVLMVAVAAFSIRSWEDGAQYDRTEDLLHSLASTGVGFAFAFGVVAVLMRRPKGRAGARAFDLAAVAAACLLPIGMGVWGEVDGVLQRAMFLIAYLWYAAEAIRVTPAFDHD
jgi:hypothetical protein